MPDNGGGNRRLSLRHLNICGQFFVFCRGKVPQLPGGDLDEE
jgi:hypothetical protein